MSEASEQIRRDWAIADAKRDEGLTTPSDVTRFDDIQYGSDPVWNSLDVYRPKDAVNDDGSLKSLPVIISVHGGAWVYGDKQLYQYYCMSLAERGFAVINFSYLRAPEAKFPSQLNDINNVVSWVMSNASKYALDTKHVFGVGDSAGGHLVSLYTCFCTNPDFAAGFTFKKPEGFEFKAIALNCAGIQPIKKLPDGKYEKEVSPFMKDLLTGGGTQEEAAEIDVPAHVTGDFPPTFIMNAIGDSTINPVEAELMMKALDDNEIPYTRKVYGDQKHRLYHVFHVDMKNPAGKLCNDEECEFFKGFI